MHLYLRSFRVVLGIHLAFSSSTMVWVKSKCISEFPGSCRYHGHNFEKKDYCISRGLFIQYHLNLTCETISCFLPSFCKYIRQIEGFNSFLANVLFLYLLKTTGNLWCSGFFRGYIKWEHW